VLEGHAFIVEAAVSIGGRDLKPGINIYRFANRIPLLFEVGKLAPRCTTVLYPTLLLHLGGHMLHRCEFGRRDSLNLVLSSTLMFVS
jgi:hypothetical protein